MEESKYWKIVALQKTSIKMKNCKICYEAQTVTFMKKIIQSPANPKPTPHQIKSYYVFGIKILIWRYTEIYRHLRSKCFKNAVLVGQKMVQIIFCGSKQNMFAGKFGKSEMLLTVLRQHIILSNEFRFVNWVRFFEQNCIVE